MKRSLSSIVSSLALLGLCAMMAGSAWAQDERAVAEPTPEEYAEAKAVLTDYLDTLVKASKGQPRKPKVAEVSKKLMGAKRLIHPKTLEVIADQEKRKVVASPLAVWHHAKADYWLTSYEFGSSQNGPLGTILFEVKEKNWRVQEGGEDGEYETSNYMLGRQKGKWYVADKRRNGTFLKSAILLGYRGYFDGDEKKPEAEQPAAPAAAPVPVPVFVDPSTVKDAQENAAPEVKESEKGAKDEAAPEPDAGEQQPKRGPLRKGN